MENNEELNNYLDSMNKTDAQATDVTGTTLSYYHTYPQITDYEMRQFAVIQAINALHIVKGNKDKVDFMDMVETIYEFLNNKSN